MPQKTSLIVLVCLLVWSCEPAMMRVDDILKTDAERMDVSGKQGWQFNQVIRFGEFHTSEVKGGWQTGYDIHFVLDFKKAEEKFSFSQFDGSDTKARVFCIGTLNMSEVGLRKSRISVPLDVEDLFHAQIFLESDTLGWDLLLYNPNEIMFEASAKGELKKKEQAIVIQPVRDLEKGSLGPQIVGYLFIDRGAPVCAVQILNNGIVWMRSGLDPELRLVLAAASSALMLRDDLDLE